MRTREELLERIFYKMVMIGNEDEYLYRPLEKQDVYDILNAETKEQQKCEYCHEPYKIIGIDYSQNLKSSLWVVDQQVTVERVSTNYPFIDRANFNINYCPVCGRKLS